MQKILIVSSSEKDTQSIAELLPCEYKTAQSGALARQAVSNGGYDIAIIICPVSDETGLELSQEIAKMTKSGVILVVKNDLAEELADKCDNIGIFVLSKPFSKQLFLQVFRLMSASRRDNAENCTLKGKADEIRLINRAKFALMQYLNMTEPSAHRYIEKRAMDMRTPKREIAKNILKTYEP